MHVNTKTESTHGISTLQPKSQHNRSLTRDKKSMESSHVRRRQNIKPFKVNILAQKLKNMENQRLWRRLSQINHRKSKLFNNNSEENSFTVNLKSRQAYRQQKKKQIQQQNNQFVERMVKRLNSYKSIFQQNSLEKISSKKKKSRRKHESFALPSLYL